jgi:crotonobetainyl-CoA:carnitine CoA-transferase CaiB-like acyl-CoA transferase
MNDELPGLSELLALRGNNAPDAAAAVKVEPGDAVYSSSYRLEETLAAAIAAVATAVCDIWQLKTGRQQSATVSVRAAGAALDSYNYLQRRDERGHFETLPISDAARVAYQLTRPFRTRDQRWYLPHFGMLHLKKRMQQILQCDDSVESVAAAIANRDADELERAVAKEGLCGGVVRSVDEWLASVQGRALATRPVIEVEKIGDSDPEPFSAGGPALHGIRILDLTRILAGPVAARTCAEHGADVLMVSARHTPQIKNFVMDLSHGKRSTWLDLNDGDDVSALRSLITQSDVFSQGYRPGVFARQGLGPAQLAAMRPGIVYLSTSCFGQHGPWSMQAGWEQVAQAVTGVCDRVDSVHPALLPVNVCDFLTGYLGAYGVLLALLRRAQEGGSYHVNVSLCQSAMFLNRQPPRSYDQPVTALAKDEIASLQMVSSTDYGVLKHLAPVAQFSETPALWRRPTTALGAHPPQWLE